MPLTASDIPPSSATEKKKEIKLSLPLKTRVAVSVMSLVTDAVRRSDGTVNRRLLKFLEPRTAASASPRRGVRSADIAVDSSRDLWFRLFVPSITEEEMRKNGAVERRRLVVIVFFHGGGFTYLSPASAAYDAVCRRISRRTVAVVASVNYRLSPEHRFPAPYDDGAAVLRFLASGGLSAADPAAASIVDLSNLFLAGDSAGANIAHHVARLWTARSDDSAIRSLDSAVRLQGLVAIQPFFGGNERTESEIRLVGAPIVSIKRTDWLWKAFLPEGADRDHPAANVFGPRDVSDLEADFPAVLVVVGGFDPLQDWQRRYFEGLRSRGKEAIIVEFPDVIHAFYAFPELRRSSELLDEIKRFVEEHRSNA